MVAVNCVGFGNTFVGSFRVKEWLSADEQLAKLRRVFRLAEDASRSEDTARRLGAFLLNAGIVDFLAIQAARLVEQIVLKAQLARGGKPSFQPHEDSYFYAGRVSTRRILKGIQRFLPFAAGEPADDAEAKRVTALAKTMVERGFEFLDYRNPVVHQIGSRRRGFDELVVLCDQANAAYQDFAEAHRVFLETAQPYGFSEKEQRRFYKPDSTGG